MIHFFKTRALFFLFSGFVVAGIGLAADDQVQQELIGQALSAYDGGDYEGAVERYEEVLARGLVNGHVLYNLGNALYRLGRKGEATAAYLAARKYLPRDPDVAANLKHAQKSAVDKVKPELAKPAWVGAVFWQGWFSLKEHLYGVALAVGLGSFLVMLSVLFTPLVKARPFGFGVWAFAGVLGLGLLVHEMFGPSWGAVTTDVARVYSGPNIASNQILFEVHEGAPVAVRESRSGWYRVELSDGNKGWLEQSQVKVY